MKIKRIEWNMESKQKYSRCIIIIGEVEYSKNVVVAAVFSLQLCDTPIIQ